MSRYQFILFALVLVSCQSPDTPDDKRKSFQPDSQKSATNDFVIPEHGELSGQQIKLYFDVQKRVAEISAINSSRTMMSTLSRDLANNSIYSTGGIQDQVLEELDMLNEEYEWIKDQIIEAGTYLMLQQVFTLNYEIIAKLEHVLEYYKDKLAKIEHDLVASVDAVSRLARLEEQHQLSSHIVEIEAQVHALKNDMKQRANKSPALIRNAELLKRYRDVQNSRRDPNQVPSS